ncbi:hypothetical protein D922_01949 [Enterococcus faecalis 06-MB-DW-09]|nr:hypothetical protein D922_01949 [Enterococcus faecalis 06-MB-DW-09]
MDARNLIKKYCHFFYETVILKKKKSVLNKRTDAVPEKKANNNFH